MGGFARQFSNFVISIFLARLLTPEQFGIVGIALVFIALTQVFIDVGFTDGLIQRQEMPDGLFSSIFYINLSISLSLALALYFTAPWIGNFYDDRDVTNVLRYLSVVPVIAALGKVHAVILTKKLDFRSLTLRDLGATIAGGILGVAAALHGMGVYSLVVQQVVFAIAGTLLLWIGSNWRPQLRFEWKEVRTLMGFSIFVFLDQVFRRVFQKLDTLFIGKVFSPAALGFYSRAESLNSQVLDYSSRSLRKIMFPVLSSVQHEQERFERIYFKTFNIAAVVSVSLAGVMYFLGEEIIIGLYGEKWAPSVILFQILVFRNITAPFGALMGKSLLSKGYAKVKFNLSLVQRAILLSPMVVGYFRGLEAFALAVVGVSVLVLLINTWAVDRYLKINFGEQVILLVKVLIPLATLMALDFLHLIPSNPWVQTALFILFQSGFIIALKHPGYEILASEFAAIFKRAFRLYKA